MVEAKRQRELIDSMFGPTNKFPDGKVGPHDEGEIAFGVTEHDGRIFIDFGTPVRQLGMTKPQAMELAATLMKRAAG
jgi:hypothetical protein